MASTVRPAVAATHAMLQLCHEAASQKARGCAMLCDLMARTKRRRPRLKDLPGGQVTELIVIVATALAIALVVQWLLVKPYRIPSGSMEPTLDVGQRVLVNRLTHRLGSDPNVGDVITFHPPAGADELPPRCGTTPAENQPCPAPTRDKSDQTFIKRVVGLGGDRITVRNGHVIRNGHPTSEPYINPCEGGQGCDFTRAVTVPRGYVFLMGDNRGASDDSRFWGPVPVSWVIGEAFATYWPPKRIGLL
jgi:signal peptidase I